MPRYTYANQITVIPIITVTHVTKDGDFERWWSPVRKWLYVLVTYLKGMMFLVFYQWATEKPLLLLPFQCFWYSTLKGIRISLVRVINPLKAFNERSGMPLSCTFLQSSLLFWMGEVCQCNQILPPLSEGCGSPD